MSILMGLFGIEGQDAAKEETKLLRMANEEREHAYMRHGEAFPRRVFYIDSPITNVKVAANLPGFN